MDFGTLPPEINSALMYSGAGSAPLWAAARAWETLGADIYTTAASYATVLADLTADWHGPAAAAMTKAFEPHLEWLNRAATQAEQVAAQAGTAAAAHDAAFAATVSPAVVEANRETLMSLLATNVLGQNTPAIAATEAAYGEMWVQDANHVQLCRAIGGRIAVDAVHGPGPHRQPGWGGSPGGRRCPCGRDCDRDGRRHPVRPDRVAARSARTPRRTSRDQLAGRSTEPNHLERIDHHLQRPLRRLNAGPDRVSPWTDWSAALAYAAP